MKKLISKSERFFIAGANGMVGQAIVKALRKSGYGKKEHGGIFLTPSRKELNLLNGEDVEKWFEINKPTVVVLAAAKVGGIQANNSLPADFILENLKIQTNVIENSWKMNVKRFLFMGSSCIYPAKSIQPIKEEYLLTGKLEDTNQWYAIAKIAGMKLCEALRKQYGFDAISVMPTNLYGPGDNFNLENSHVLPALLRKFYEAKLHSRNEVICWGSGRPRREFMFIDDFGKACVFILENFHPGMNGDDIPFLNVGTGSDLTIKELAEKIANLFNFKGNIIWDTKEPDGTYQKKLNVEKLNRLGWEYQVSIDEGLKKTLDYFVSSYKSKEIRL